MNPTYHSLGNHSESIEIDYDPTVVSYEDLLTIFWEGHDPGARPWSTQYKAAVFYHNDGQKKLAEKSRERIETTRKIKVRTEIVPFTTFWLAEAYHQKYSLRAQSDIMDELRKIYPSDEAFVNSTVTARANGYLNGLARFEDVEAVARNSKIPAQKRESLLATIKKRGDGFGSAFCGLKG
jgi:peptide-methionine (S)-S-oxide reductase